MDPKDRLSLPSSSLPISSLERSLSSQYLTNSYKVYWFLAILDKIKNFPDESSLVVDFHDLFTRMIALSWYPILEFRLNFGTADGLEKIVRLVNQATGMSNTDSFENILDAITNIKDNEIHEKLRELGRYVPYRFLTTFIPDLTGVPDSQRNRIISERSRNLPDVPYMILDDTSLMFNSRWLEYFYINRMILKGWAEMKLTDFLQARNPNIPAIHLKLSAPVSRSLSAAQTFWSLYLDESEEKDIFSGSLLAPDSISIDHFIPWSFVLHDRIWNLIPTSKSVNSSKGNRLPPWDDFFPSFAGIQYRAYNWHQHHHIKNKLLEDYLLIGLSNHSDKLTFRNALEKTLQPSWRIAENQGFGIWEANRFRFP